MSVLGGFLSTWTRARSTFGEGVPEPGATFDSSSALHQLEADTRAAAPASVWSGAAADMYDTKNAEQVRTLSRMAELDQSIGVEVDRSAEVVAHGRRQLDTVRDWVLTAAGSVPKGPAGEQMLVPIVAKGCSDITDIVTTSNGELATIAERIRTLGSEYGSLGGAGEPMQGNPPPVDPLEEILRRYQVSEDPDGTREWEPPWPLNMMTEPKHVTAAEARILDELSPLEMRDMDQIKDAASVEAKVRFPPQNGVDDTADNHTDAFRHTYWNALMTQRFGEQWTRDFATAHERLPNNPATAEAMDLYNNELGRQIAVDNPDATPAELADLVEQAVNNGDTVVIAPGGERLAWSDTIALGEAGTTTAATVPGLPPMPTGTGPGGIYDPGQPGGYGTSAGGY
ncbi:EspA/EspE family type VII secretion system effector [Mycolicibacterium sp. BiH015]|uniref:DUF6973 domain-containing protein n=1 Tax=Mycolicibacterium sp. BiH015 TaxID=3018808 RepID=UPI0022E7C2B8|nr:EspA/EspE family type VII secretion system effector [Mycolicibacterium sp. BiH015]MDA2889543.1 EspA/EspE family type VII secretion system effector [Mycolicibacterium sp. BiH015]